MAYQESAKEEIKRTADIVELVGLYVQLRKAGRNYVGLCPFHAEKAPSFSVNPERQTFHCFGCKKGGDIFSFWMEYHSTTFPEAIRDLAEKYQITLSEGFDAPQEKRKAAQKRALFKINETATAYFQRALTHPTHGRSGRKYLTRRSISDEIIGELRLGYAPNEWDGLVRILKDQKLELEMAVQAGVIIPNKSGGYYDRFRNRVIFPIFDLRQQIVGFGGRVLDDSLPKYLNTPESPIFHKGEFLYGLHVSNTEIRKQGRAIIVEGYMDWLALRMHGIKEVVATLGTALTAGHVRKLKGYAKETVIVFDSDEAGKAATLRSLPIFSNEGVSAKAVVLPAPHDPDSFVNANGAGAFLDMLRQAPPMLDFYLEQKLAESGSDLEEKIGLLKDMYPVLFELQSSTQRALYVRRLSERIGIKEHVVWSELSKSIKQRERKTFSRNLKNRMTASKVEKRFNELHLLNLLVHHPEILSRLVNYEWESLLSDAVILEIVGTLFDTYYREGACSVDDLMESLENEPARNQLREVMFEDSHFSDQEVEQAVTEIEEKVRRLSISASFRKVKGDVEAQNKLLELKRLKGRGSLGIEI
ncbi:MAG: DNA primase [Desulfatiglandaceae bacterium]